MRIFLAIPLLFLAAFCSYGLLASFEPGTPAHFRVGYPILGIACLAAALALLAAGRKAS